MRSLAQQTFCFAPRAGLRYARLSYAVVSTDQCLRITRQVTHDSYHIGSGYLSGSGSLSFLAICPVVTPETHQ